MMSQKRITHARENSAPPHVVLTNDDLLTEIFIRLPILYSRLDLRKSTMDNSFTLCSNEEADNVRILQSCNVLLLCTNSGRPAFDYIADEEGFANFLRDRCDNLRMRISKGRVSIGEMEALGAREGWLLIV
ncbi:hypothetical protein Tco_1179628 [Tanacetum coccineum]